MLKKLTPYAVLFVFVIMFVQTAHMLEHVAQVTQKFVLHMKTAPGFLGSIFDLEWVHFLYNSLEEVALIAIFLWWRRHWTDAVPFALTGGVYFQGYHTVEHIVKMYQYYALGIHVGPKGILGFVFPLIWLHFFLNLITLLFIYGIWRAIRPKAVRRTDVAPVPA